MNGNGDTKITRQTHGVQDELAAELAAEAPWLKALRESMADSVKGDDLKAIMQVQIDKAKEGDRRAADFVFKQAHQIMRGQQRPVTITQNNYYDTPAERRPDTPIEPGDDREREISKLSARARAGAPLIGRPDDRRVRPVSDEEEKELRRRQQAEEAERDAETGPEGD